MSRLSIYVSEGCAGCERALQIAGAVRAQYPAVLVEVVDVAHPPPNGIPDDVMAVPSYLLDGIVISLGNPDPATLRDRLAAASLAGA